MKEKMSTQEILQFLQEENIVPERLILKYNINHTRAKVVISGLPVRVTNFMKEENAQKVIDEYKRFCKIIGWTK